MSFLSQLQQYADGSDYFLKNQAYRGSRLKALFEKDWSFEGVTATLDQPKGVALFSTQEARSTFSSWYHTRKNMLHAERNPLVHWHWNVFEGHFLYVEPEKKIEQVLTLRFSGGSVQWPSFFCYVARNAHVRLHILFPTLGDNHMLSGLLDFEVDEGGSLEIVIEATHMHTVSSLLQFRGRCGKSASMRVLHVTEGGSVNQLDMGARLDEAAHFDWRTGAWLSKQSHWHADSLVHHTAPHATSLQSFKHVVNDRALSSFQGKIYVDAIAQKTVSYQNNNNLILSRSAKARGRPNLEIFADDVRASHGATFGKIDPENLFYLQSRGLAIDQSRVWLTRAFLEVLLGDFDQFSLDQVHASIRSYL